MPSCWRSKMSSLDRAAYIAGTLSCAILIASALSACQALRETEELLRHKAVECVYTDKGKICKEGKS